MDISNLLDFSSLVAGMDEQIFKTNGVSKQTIIRTLKTRTKKSLGDLGEGYVIIQPTGMGKNRKIVCVAWKKEGSFLESTLKRGEKAQGLLTLIMDFAQLDEYATEINSGLMSLGGGFLKTKIESELNALVNKSVPEWMERKGYGFLMARVMDGETSVLGFKDIQDKSPEKIHIWTLLPELVWQEMEKLGLKLPEED